jgi:diguanylate cyclase (GGDEF)-like protein
MITRWLYRYGITTTVIIFALAIGLTSFTVTLLIHNIFSLEIMLYGLIISGVLPMLIAPPILYAIFRTLIELSEAKATLEKMATIDSLTGVPNRAHFIKLAKKALADAPPAQPVGLAVIDIDRFKLINDYFGHLAGDKALKTITKTITSHLRPEDIFGRFGGDEFILLVPNASSTEINRIAQDLLGQIREISIGQNGHQMPLSVTIGVTAGAPANTSLRKLIAIADSALIQAKQAGGRTTRYARRPYPLPNPTNGLML